MIDGVQIVIDKIRMLFGLVDPTFMQAVFLLYFSSMFMLYQTGNLTADMIREITMLAFFMIMIGYMWGLVLIDKETDE